jgi:hypothetical protein
LRPKSNLSNKRKDYQKQHGNTVPFERQRSSIFLGPRNNDFFSKQSDEELPQ